MSVNLRLTIATGLPVPLGVYGWRSHLDGEPGHVWSALGHGNVQCRRDQAHSWQVRRSDLDQAAQCPLFCAHRRSQAACAYLL